jgi:hypothetical protein
LLLFTSKSTSNDYNSAISTTAPLMPPDIASPYTPLPP